jgi:peptide chain release factor 2
MSKDDGDEAGSSPSSTETAKLSAIIEELEFRRMFSNQADPLNCFLDIQAGAGGTEACDWASMLLRQYLKYAERKGFKTTVEDETAGDVAGIKGATIKIEGEYAFGLLRTETGVHRLVRKSPFDSRAGATPALPACLSTPRSTTRSRSTSTPATCAPTPTAPAARAASTSTRPTRPCA